MTYRVPHAGRVCRASRPQHHAPAGWTGTPHRLTRLRRRSHHWHSLPPVDERTVHAHGHARHHPGLSRRRQRPRLLLAGHEHQRSLRAVRPGSRAGHQDGLQRERLRPVTEGDRGRPRRAGEGGHLPLRQVRLRWPQESPCRLRRCRREHDRSGTGVRVRGPLHRPSLHQSRDEVVAALQSYDGHAWVSRLMGGVVRSVPLVAYRYDIDAVLAAVNERTRIIWICNPYQPYRHRSLQERGATPRRVRLTDDGRGLRPGLPRVRRRSGLRRRTRTPSWTASAT